MSQRKLKSAEARPASQRISAHPPLKLPPLFCPWGADINFKHRRAALSVIHRPLGVRCVRVYFPPSYSPPSTAGRKRSLSGVFPPPCMFPPPPCRVRGGQFSSIFGRTDLIIAASKAKNCGEVDGEVRLPVEAPKLAQKDEKRCPTRKQIVEKKFFSPKIELTGIV